MVKFGSFYFAAEQIAIIKRDKSLDVQFPERLIVAFKDGSSYSMNFRSVQAVENEMRGIANQIERDQFNRLDKIKEDVSHVLYYLRAIEKRQLRILRILRKLPGTSAEEINEALEG